jgi:sterol desaturase/sphingolipid hydroxylase (fatty acid hydroxylase superfamily)
MAKGWSGSGQEFSKLLESSFPTNFRALEIPIEQTGIRAKSDQIQSGVRFMLKFIRTKILSELETPRADRPFGTGWISGTLGLTAAIAGLAFVIALKFPHLFTTPELRVITLSTWFRFVIFFLLISAFALAALSMVLRERKTLGVTTLSITLLATLLGGLHVTPPAGEVQGALLGLDFFVVNVIFLGFIYIPLERLFPHRPEQTVLRTEWREDLFYYLISSMMVQMLMFLTLAPSRAILSVSGLETIRAAISSQPFVLQVIEIMFLTDFAQYWLHRAFHRVPALWKFHSVHHSAQAMDWIAGARMHFLEVIVLRAVTATPMFVLGFSEAALQTYILIVYVYASLLHSNLQIEPKWLSRFLATPRFHHWHHGIEREAIDVNFAIHFPLFDRLFGTHHMPEDRWPEGYGIGGHPVPKGYIKQMLYPFKRP